MTNRVRITRFNPAADGELLWNIYQNPEYAEFFRRVPATWIRSELQNIEVLTQALMFTVLWDEWPCGFALVASISSFDLSCQAGLLLFPEYRDKVVDKAKIAFWGLYRLCEMLFDRTTMRRVSFRFLKDRTDIEQSLSKAGLVKEAEFKESTFCGGEFRDELEYACTIPIFKKIKESVVWPSLQPSRQ